jgi:alanine dehydrogenase
MRIAVPAELAGERRVAITPQVALRLIEDRHTVIVESGAGGGAGFEDAAYDVTMTASRP